MDFLQANLSTIVFILVLVGFFGYRTVKFRAARAALAGLLAEGGQLVDVRGPGEFVAGHNPRSQNIPLPDLPARLGSLDKSKPVIVCCASGTRSGMAAGILRGAGFTRVVNAGPWRNTLIG